MLRCYPDTELAWDTENLKWVKPINQAEPVLPVELLSEMPETDSIHFTQVPMSESDNFSFKSDFSRFDEKLGGLEIGEVVVITGHTKQGKTLFAESWVKNLMQKEPLARTLFFSFEVQTKKLVVKYLGDPTLPLYFPKDIQAMNYEWFKACCQKARDTHGTRIVLIDHLHFMIDMAMKQNMSLNIGGFMRKLKHEIAIGMELAVILIAHQGQAPRDQSASLHSIRDSSFVAQEADSIISVSRRKNLNDVELKDYAIKYGEEKAEWLKGLSFMKDPEDNMSANLALVTIERTRRTGTFDYKKMFYKNGDFMEEI